MCVSIASLKARETVLTFSGSSFAGATLAKAQRRKDGEASHRTQEVSAESAELHELVSRKSRTKSQENLEDDERETARTLQLLRRDRQLRTLTPILSPGDAPPAQMAQSEKSTEELHEQALLGDDQSPTHRTAANHRNTLGATTTSTWILADCGSEYL